MGRNRLRFLSILMAAVFFTFTGSLAALAADPVAFNDTYGVDEDEILTVPVDGVLNNDFDPDVGDSLQVSEVNGDSAAVDAPTPTANGTVTLNSNGSFTYTPSSNFFGTDAFTYRISDGMANSNEAR